MKDKIKYYLLLIAFLCLMALILFLCHDWLTDNSDALMVLITFIYVVATFEICKANIKSADATREQLAESKRQFEESKRLQMMPYFVFEMPDGNHMMNRYIPIDLCSDSEPTGKNYCKNFCMKNIGPNAAKQISCSYEIGTEIIGVSDFPYTHALNNDEKRFDLQISVPKRNDDSSAQYDIKLNFEFSDLLENHYSQYVLLSFMLFSDSFELVNLWASEPQLQKQEENHA